MTENKDNEAVKAGEEKYPATFTINGVYLDDSNYKIKRESFIEGWNAHQSQLEEENKRLRELLKRHVQDAAFINGKMWDDNQQQIEKRIEDAWITFMAGNNL